MAAMGTTARTVGSTVRVRIHHGASKPRASRGLAWRQHRPCAAASATKGGRRKQSGAVGGSSVEADRAKVSKWASESDIQADALELADFDGLRGMRATCDIKGDDTIVSLPKEAALLVTPRLPCPFPETCDRDMWRQSPWWFKMALLLLEERRLGDSSRLSGYVGSLPPSFDTPIHWTEEELQHLQYAPLVADVKKQQGDWQAVYDKLADSTPGTPVTKEDLCWAMECVRSRCFSGPYAGGNIRDRAVLGVTLVALGAAAVAGGKVLIEDVLNGLITAFSFNILYDFFLSKKLKWYAMCPVIDFMNHKSTVESDVSWEYFTDRFTVNALKDWKRGEQVFINYGAQTNDSLLQYYGFVEEDNPNDTFTIKDFDELLSAVNGGGSGPELWAKANISQQLQEVTLSRKGVPASVVVASRLLQMTEADMKAKGLEASNAELPAAQEAAALRSVAAACQKALDGMGTSLEADLASMKKRPDSSRESLALQLRVQKKGLLADQIVRLEKKAAALG